MQCCLVLPASPLPNANGAAAVCRFAWGPAALALQQLSQQQQQQLQQPQAEQEQVRQHEEREREQRQRVLLLQRLPLDPLRCALTVAYWPEGCTLLGEGGSSGSSSSADGASGGDGGGDATQGCPLPIPPHPAAYDPGFLLPFCLRAARGALLPPRTLAASGLLSVCLRGLAAQDPGACARFLFSRFLAFLHPALPLCWHSAPPRSVLGLAAHPPALRERFVTIPKVPNRYDGTVSSIILGNATPNIPPQNPKPHLRDFHS